MLNYSINSMIKSFNLKLNIIVYIFIYLKCKLFNKINDKIFLSTIKYITLNMF